MGDVLADVANGKAHSIDHVNLFAKGMLDATDLTADEMAMYDRCYACETFDEVVALAKEFINEFVSDKAMGMDGYLFPAGLVPLSEADFAKQIAAKGNL